MRRNFIDRFYKLATKTGLEAQINALRPQLAAAAQSVYDDWNPDGPDGDWQVGNGGICHLIADKMLDVLHTNIPDITGTTISSSHEVHVYVVIGKTTIDEAGDKHEDYYSVDIDPYLYESGGGYSWTKKPGITIDPSDIVVDWAEALETDEDGYVIDY